MSIPVIDFDSFKNERELALVLDENLQRFGFVLARNIGMDFGLKDAVIEVVQSFFSEETSKKMNHAYEGTSNNFGYQGALTEKLDPKQYPDIKETFTMRNLTGRADDLRAWPDPVYRQLSLEFYDNCQQCAFNVLRIFAIALDADRDYFVDKHSGENITMRYLHYPAFGYECSSPSQMGAGSHTDYGAITLLLQDNVGGLQLKLPSGVWLDVPHIEGTVVINTGDLMQIWSNDRYPSTEHRVLPRLGFRDRYSIAFFTDPDSEVLVTPLASCVADGRKPNYSPVTAGDHILAKLNAAQIT